MKLKTIKTLAIIQAVLLGSYVPMAIAASSKTSPEVAKLDNIEEVIYGAPKSSVSLDTRLKDLELKLFGITRKGTTTERLAAIEKTLAYGSGAATSGSLLPPLAPTLDTPATASSAPTSASSSPSSSHYESDEPYPVDSSGALADAMQLYQDGKVAQAEGAFHGILAKDPSNGDAYYNLAVIAEGKNDLNGALSYYRSALNLNPQDSDLQSAVVSVQNKLAQSVGPSHVASSASSSSSSYNAPKAAPAQNKAADEARKSQLKSAVASASNDYKAGNYESAVTKLNSVASQVPDDGDVQFALAQAYRAKGDLSNARSHMARASSLNPASSSFGSALADIDRAIAAKNTLPADSFASSNQPGSIPQTASQPEGQITPFSGSKAANLDSGNLNGVAYTSRSNSSRLKRAATYGLAGAAAGALSGALFSSSNNGSRMSSAKSSALRGAVLGAVFGFASGK
ncbi:MAG: tetratricopeptide repeat protein [Candidatus Obscuribacterales bacterium]|jgi:Tfp pilus assembly protein PilF